MSLSIMPLVTVGFINYSQKEGYSSSKYLTAFLESLISQGYSNLEILCLDNASTDDGKSLRLIEKYPQIRIIKNSTNEGFVAHNRLIEEAKGEYYLCTNFDVVLDKECIKNLVEGASLYPKGGSFGGTSYQWDFTKNICTQVVDTTGLCISKSHHVRDREMGTTVSFASCGKRDMEEIFGVSGVNVLYRKSALDSVKDKQGGYFDPHFFMYKEDVDMAYRLRWEGWESYYIPSARIWHDRSVGESVKSRFRNLRILRNRAHKSKENRVLSVRNHLFLLYKNFSWNFSWKIKCATMWDEVRKFFWVLFFEPLAFNAYGEFWKMRKGLVKSKRVVNTEEMERWFVRS